MKEKEYYTKNRKIIPRTKKIFIPAIGISILSIFLFIITFTPDAAAVDCSYCHLTYTNEISGTFHGGADRCILCHSSYTSSFPHPGTSVNETKCRDCHVQNQSGFYERHSSSSDCTTCHFANTTVLFEFNSARFKHSHNLTVEYNYYSYNLYGIPANASRTGKGMFPYYACTLACHKNYGEPLKIDEAAISWNESAHARSRHGDETYDSKNSCAKCKSPPNYNSSASSSTAIAEADWQGIQCRVCHNLHDRKYPNNTGPGGFPIAFYNSTSSSIAGYSVYEQVSNATELCQRCHTGTADSKFAGTHKDTVGFNCTNCHMNSSFNDELHTFEVKNTTSEVTGCEVCHNPEDHTFQATSQHTGKVECVACHDQTVSRNASGYAVSSDNNNGIYKDPALNKWTTYKLSHGAPATWPLHNISKNVSCNKCHSGAQSVFNGTIPGPGNDNDLCGGCHAAYGSAVLSTRHNQTLNPGAPDCTGCHTGYEPVNGHTSGNRGYTVNESNTCRNCHVQNESGFYESHSSSSDCTTCHFANTTVSFEFNSSLFKHSHNLTVEYNYYSYNLYGIPANASRTGKGMFPYYACTLACHKNYGEPLKIDEAAISWNESAHARSRHGDETYDSKNSCAKCKSPPNYNSSASSSTAIAEADWQGIQCRVCHNLHDLKYPNNTGPGGLPIAFYNSTSSSIADYSVYEQVSNATELCQKCHAGSSHDSKFAGTHKDTLGFNCTNCHMNSSFNNELHTFEVKNTTSEVTGCEVCHNPEDHTFQATSQHTGKVECVACHDQTVSRNASGYAVSSDNNNGIYKDPALNKWTTYKLSHGAPATWPLHNISKNVSCNKCHSGAQSVFNGTIGTGNDNDLCGGCHAAYGSAVLSTRHNQTLNPGAPDCTGCHTGYEPVNGHTSGNRGYTVNESNTCRNCHVQNESGFYERHSSSSDCTTCHFANTTVLFEYNASLFTHDHNLTIEHNFYEYNQSGTPVRTNGGTGAGMFPYYTCTLTCHEYNATTGVEGKVDDAAKSWFNSSHARSLHYPASSDNKMSCARCKSPANYNISENQNSLITAADWQGIQCRVCHNLHDLKYPNNTGPGGLPIAFYNSTGSSLAGYAVYEQVSNATELCQKCHTGTTHDSKFAGTHKDTVGFSCTNCHMNSSFNTELHTFEVKNTTSDVTGCKVCHEYPGTSHNNIDTRHVNVSCEGCHDNTVSRNSSDYVVSSDNKNGLYKDSANNWTTYKLSHGEPATWPLHNISKNVSCDKCHGARSAFSGAIAPAFSGGLTYNTTGALVSGYNLIVVLLNPEPAIYAQNLTYPVSGGIPGVNKLLNWNSTDQKWDGYEYIDGIYYGTNFVIDGYKPYFVRGNSSTAGQTYTFRGRR